MSHEATAWAWKIRGLKPATKIVLLHLADRHNPDNGCFPSIRRLAEDCEMSVRSVHTHITQLEDAGLVKRTARVRESGQQSSNEYVLNMGVQNLHTPPAKSAPPTLQNLHTNNLVSNNPVSLTIFDQRRADLVISDNFHEIWAMYPRKAGKGAARKAYERAVKKICPNTLHQKLEAFTQALSASGTEERYIPHLSTWLNQERWDDELPKQRSGVDQGFRDMVNDLARVKR